MQQQLQHQAQVLLPGGHRELRSLARSLWKLPRSCLQLWGIQQAPQQSHLLSQAGPHGQGPVLGQAVHHALPDEGEQLFPARLASLQGAGGISAGCMCAVVALGQAVHHALPDKREQLFPACLPPCIPPSHRQKQQMWQS